MLDFNRFYNGKEEPPIFRNQFIDLKDKISVPNEFGLLVILTLIWGSKETFDFAFGNVEKGSIVAVSSQAVEGVNVFKKGFVQAVKTIEPQNICWYGNVFDWVADYYNVSKIVKMQTRTQLIRQKRFYERDKLQGNLFSA